MSNETGTNSAKTVVMAGSATSVATAKNVIFLLPDGFGQAADNGYRDFKTGDSAPIWEEYLQGRVETKSADNPVTDSAASANAYATGVKTFNGGVGIDAEGNAIDSVLDLASQAGKATGIVSTAAIWDASPAAFAASNVNRGNAGAITQEYIDNNDLDVILGGGRAAFREDTDGDGRTTIEEARANGFDYVTTAAGLARYDGDRLLGLFNNQDMLPPIGGSSLGKRTNGEPSLAEMTRTALDVLKQDQDGFFLFVEEEGTDTWGHANDAGTVFHSGASFEQAWQVALDYAEKNPDTLIVSVADHETGGMTLELGDGRLPSVFRKFEATYEEIGNAINEAVDALGANPSESRVNLAVKAVVSDLTGGAVNLTSDEVGAIVGAADEDAAYALLAETLNARGGIEFSTTGHTAVDVPLYAYGAGSELFQGNIDNTKVGRALAEAMGLSLPPNAIRGTAGKDSLKGTGEADAISGLSGNDRIDGRAGDDTITGGAGNDVIAGGAGDDTAVFNVAKDGRDETDLGTGSDLVRVSGVPQVRLTFTSAEVGNVSATDSDTLANQDGGLAVRLNAENASGVRTGVTSRFDDEGVTFAASAGKTFDVRDLVSGVQRGDQFEVVTLGTQSSDTLTAVQATRGYYFNAGLGNDTVTGGLDGDFLVGGAGNDALSGSRGDDSFIGGRGNDTVEGGTGNDTAIFNVATDNRDETDLGAGSDVVDVSGATQVRLTFTSAEVGNGSATDADALANQDGGLAVRLNAENASGSRTGVTSRFDDEGVTFAAADGTTFDVRDLVSGAQRGDEFEVVTLGTNRADTLKAVENDRSSYFNAGAGNDTVTGGAADDFLVGGTGKDRLSGGSGNDTFIGGAHNDIVNGGAGTDRAIFTIARGDATFDFGPNNSVTIKSSLGTDRYTGVEEFQFTDGVVAYDDLGGDTAMIALADASLSHGDLVV